MAVSGLDIINFAFIESQKETFEVSFLSFVYIVDLEIVISVLKGTPNISVLMSNCHIPCF